MEKQGYPNPDYTENDIGQVLESGVFEICMDHYEELVRKATVHDILVSVMKAHGTVSDDVLTAVLGVEMDEALKAARAEESHAWDMYFKVKEERDQFRTALESKVKEENHE